MTESNIELQFMVWRKKSQKNQLPARKSTSGAGKSIFGAHNMSKYFVK